jgi:predicted DNA-binding WGR domain protein
MTAVTLTRTDHARRMARFYVLDVQPERYCQMLCIGERRIPVK